MTRAARLLPYAWMPLVLLGLLVIYLPGLDNPLLFDDSFLTDGSMVEYGMLTELRQRALSFGSFIWLQDLLGEGWWKQRVVNLLLHAGVILSLWALYRELLRHIEPAGTEQSPALALGIAFFALNPVAVYGVAYLIQRSILMATLFTVLSLWAFARGMARRKAGYHVAALLLYVVAVWSKEHAILAPLAALPIYVVVARPSGSRLAAIGAVLGVAIAAFAWLMVNRFGGIIGQAFDEFSRVYLRQLAQLDPAAPSRAYPLSILNQAWLFFEYGVRWMIPYTGWMSINLRPPFPLTYGTFPQVLGVIGYAGVIAGGAFLVLRYRDWRALLGLSLLLPALLFATEFAIVWVQDPFVLYRSYLWAIGIPGLVFCLVQGTSSRALMGVGVFVGALLCWQALDRVLSMASAEHVWTDAIYKLPNDPRAVGRWFPYLSRGNAYLDREELDLAIADFANSSTLGDMGMGNFNMGAVLAAKGRHPQALEAFDKAEREGYDLYNLPVQRGLSLAAVGRLDEAYQQLQAAKAKGPPSPTREVVLLNLGRLGLQLRKSDAALVDLQQLVSVDPRNKEGRYLLGMAMIGNGQNDRAREVFDALLAEEQSVPALYGRALANYQSRRNPQALADIETALRADPNNPQLRGLQERIRSGR